MASFDLFLEVHKTSRFGFDAPETYGALRYDERVPRKNLIHAPAGIVSVEPGTTPSEVVWVPWRILSGISGYDALQLTTAGVHDQASVKHTFTYPPLDPEVALQEYVTGLNDLEGKQVRNSTMTFKITTKHTHVLAERNIFVYTEVYHRTSGGTETLLKRTTTNVGFNIPENVFTLFTFDVTLNTRFRADERLVIKYRAKDGGVPL